MGKAYVYWGRSGLLRKIRSMFRGYVPDNMETTRLLRWLGNNPIKGVQGYGHGKCES